ncbi:glycerophosphodiester phosphodiesterase [Companilactobacillus halodurans]|uniref:Hydrolase n=1 Tax=Companilactobacillus halodurans TaxID=2584183 RepID=A0A5P0ZRK5_9LACO|nr:glycerophosphodiester phosphodiesterase [Companilactobacillus halodurans]MQS76877.1 hydrolase [Companilactobacillus halodurans]MQS98109.1 hydrolase [Companilactobacillus halodurans]
MIKRKLISTLLILLALPLTATSVQAAKVPGAKNLTPVTRSVNHASPSSPIIFSHRGSPYNNPDHSFSGYNRAIKDGTQYIEQDVWLSKDGKLFVSHDDNLKKSTGHNVTISTSNSSKIKKVKLNNGEKIHQLKDVFNRYDKKVHYIIEAKKNAGDNTDTEKALVKEVKKYKMTKNIIMQDASLPGIKSFHKSLKKVPTLWLLDSASERQYREQIENAPRYIDFISLKLDQWTPKLVKIAHKNGFKTNGWVLNTYNDNYTALNTLKLDSVFTNDTKETAKLISHWK